MTTISITRQMRAHALTRVLICDDDRDRRMTLGIVLRSEGYVVHFASHGTEALTISTAYRPDVAFLDLQLPQGSGFDVAQELQRRFPHDCPVLIAMTLRSDEADRKQAEISGFHYVLVKPYDPQEVIELLVSIEPGPSDERASRS